MQVDVPPVSEQKEASNELTPAVQGSVQDPPLEIVMTEQELLTFSGFYPSTFTDPPSDIYHEQCAWIPDPPVLKGYQLTEPPFYKVIETRPTKPDLPKIPNNTEATWPSYSPARATLYPATAALPFTQLQDENPFS